MLPMTINGYFKVSGYPPLSETPIWSNKPKNSGTVVSLTEVTWMWLWFHMVPHQEKPWLWSQNMVWKIGFQSLIHGNLFQDS